MGLVVEALRSIGLPCSATVVVPAALAVVAAGGRRLPAVAAVSGAVVGTFVTVAWAPQVPEVLHGIVLAVAFVAAALADRAPWPASARAVATAAATVAIGVGAGLLWRPCVGAELGDVLTEAVRAPWPALPGVATYTGMLAAPGAALASWLVPSPGGRAATTARTRRAVTVARWTAVALGVGLAATVAAGLGDEVTATLYRWSR